MTTSEEKLHAFVNQLVGDLGATNGSILVLIGDRLGLWKAMAASGPVTPAELARRTECAERYIREWLDAQASAGYVTYDPTTRSYTLPPEHAAALADETSPVFFAGAFEIAAAAWMAVDKATQNFRTGNGMEWGHHHPCLFQGTERFFRSSYVGNLVSSWLPALDGVTPKLEKGALVADVGCGVGASTILMAKAFPRSRFRGFDYHAGSIELARKRAEAAGVADRVTFAVAKSTDFPKEGAGYDLVCHFDCLHDMEDPKSAAKRVREAIAPDGTWMIVEPFASDRPEENHNPVGRIYYAASTMLCVPHSLAFGGPALGAQAGEARLRDVVNAGAFTKVRRVIDTPFNMVLEARP
ncbi:MAG TPA: class I SAM-dependent methyltransferase [Labilithrix sp.]|jgi:2-polyprenyl-3-methyl-5-hydroxy-6-metoxy-1,4-benzoquinol methylase|nr:class I SAM-dependent methyltransferase [Labilithrix sp.]